MSTFIVFENENLDRKFAKICFFLEKGDLRKNGLKLKLLSKRGQIEP